MVLEITIPDVSHAYQKMEFFGRTGTKLSISSEYAVHTYLGNIYL